MKPEYIIIAAIFFSLGRITGILQTKKHQFRKIDAFKKILNRATTLFNHSLDMQSNIISVLNQKK